MILKKYSSRFDYTTLIFYQLQDTKEAYLYWAGDLDGVPLRKPKKISLQIRVQTFEISFSSAQNHNRVSWMK
jgi:hypothetical protein